MRVRAGRPGAWVARAALVGAAALATIAPLAPAAPVAADEAPNPTPIGVPAATQTNLSPYPVLERLGLWRDGRFHAVTPGSLGTAHVIVMSHGWSPGYRDAYQQLQAAHPEHLVTAWDPELVDGAGQSMMSGFEKLAERLHDADVDASIVMFSWVDQSSTGTSVLDASGPELATEVNGHRLATALDQALVPGFAAGGGQLHLIGHSFGANVVTTAALALAERPRQVTLLDSPEAEVTRIGGAKNDLRYKLPRLDPGRGPGQTFVDNYISEVGERYSTYPGLADVVDVRTAPPDGDLSEKHSFAITWYAESTDRDSHVGSRWSPLTGADVATLATSYEQPEIARPHDLDQVEGPPPPGVRERLAVTTAPLLVAGSTGTSTGSSTGSSLDGDGTGGSTGDELVVSGTPGGAASPGPTTDNLTFSTSDDSLWLTFDQQLSGRPGDLVTLFVDGRERSQAAVGDAGTGPAGSFVILYDLAPGSHVLSATISGPTTAAPADPSSRATLGHLAVASTSGITRNLTATETYHLAVAVVASGVAGVLALLGLVVLVVVLVVRHRRRQGQGDRPD